MNKRWRNIGLYVLLVVVVVVVGTAFLDRPDPATTARTLRYSDFVEAVQEDQVSRVLISPDRGTAQVVENDGRRAEVNLAPDKELLGLLTQHNVDIAVQPTRQPSAWQQAASSLIFPLLLLGGLFFLFRRAQGGGGGNPAVQKQSRVQMEPSTQVTFTDVAGIEGAKLELLRCRLPQESDRFTAVGAKVQAVCLLVLQERAKLFSPRLLPAGWSPLRFQVLNSSRCSWALEPAGFVTCSSRPENAPASSS